MTLMLKEPITVLVRSTINGPGGIKMKPGQVAVLEDSPYVRVLIKSESVSLVDPPSLDPEFLEKAGYELRAGYTYPVKPVVEKAPVRRDPKTMPTINRPKVSEEAPEKVSEGKDDSKEDGIEEK